MDMVRNFINVSGLADTNDLPVSFGGQMIQYSETDTISVPKNLPDIKSIFQAVIGIEKRSIRNIKTQTGYTLVLDGIKKLKMMYAQNDSSGKAGVLDLDLPYNTFIELPSLISMDNISIYILDAFFSLLDPRKIYSHLVFLVSIAMPTDVSYANTSNDANRAYKQLKSEVAELSSDNNQITVHSVPYKPETDNSMNEKPDRLVDVDEEYL